MIYLIASIFVYLLVALALGAVGGWLWRDMQAAREEEVVRRKVKESRARLPQMEEAIRAREEQFEVVRHEYNEREDELASTKAMLAERNRTVEELEAACADLRARLELAAASSETPNAQAEPPDDADPQQPQDPGLQQALAATRDELEQLRRALSSEQRRVEELTRERELQRRALAALEQQLELARERQSRTANG